MTGRATICDSTLEAVAGIADGATVLVGGFGSAGEPVELVEALLAGGARDLIVVSNNAGDGDHGLAALIRDGRVRKVICSYPRQSDSWHFDAAYRAAHQSDELGNLVYHAGLPVPGCLVLPDAPRLPGRAGPGRLGHHHRRQARVHRPGPGQR